MYISFKISVFIFFRYIPRSGTAKSYGMWCAQSYPTFCNPMDGSLPGSSVHEFSRQKHWSGGAVLRWQRNRMGRPLSPPQIYRKNIWTLSKFHKTTSECWQRTSGPQKAAHCLREEVGQNTKDKKRDKRGRDGDPSQEGSLKREVSKHQETLLTRVCGESWNLRGQHNQEEK